MPGGNREGGGLEVKSAYKAQGRIDPDAMVSRGKGTSGFQMKYQGKHSAFPFKSPMKQNYHRAAVGQIGRDKPKKFKETKVGQFFSGLGDKAKELMAKRRTKIHKKQGKA